MLGCLSVMSLARAPTSRIAGALLLVVSVAARQILPERPQLHSELQNSSASPARASNPNLSEVARLLRPDDGKHTSVDDVEALSAEEDKNLRSALKDLQEERNLWPYPAKVAVVICLFVLFEYLLDFFAWCLPRTHPRFQSKQRAQHHALRMEAERQQDPSLLRKITALTLNVWMNQVREYADRQVKGIRELSPDVIFLQEVFHLDVLETYRRTFPDYSLVAFGRASNCTAVCALSVLMLGLAAFFAGSLWLVERFIENDNWRTVWLVAVPVMMAIYSHLIRHHWTIAFLTGNRTGLAVLVRNDAVEIQDRKCVTFSRAGHAADFLNIFRPRGFISVSGLMQMPGRPPLRVRFVTTHLNQPLEQALRDGRHRQVKEVFEKCHKDDELLVLGCDLNATPPGTSQGSDCNTYADVTKEMSDAWREANPSDPTRDGITWDQSENPLCVGLVNRLFYGTAMLRWRCDYIFWRYRQVAGEIGAAVGVRMCNLVFTGSEAVSDHFGVFAVFDVRDGTSSAAQDAART